MKDKQEPLLFLLPSFHLNITEALLQNVKYYLSQIKSGWTDFGHCGKSQL